MRSLPSFCISAIAALCFSATTGTSGATELKIVSSIKPVHSLVSAVLGETGNSSLLMQGSATPHSFSFRPSQARELEAANVIFWIGPEMETFLETALATLASDATVVTLEEAKGLVRQERREGGAFEEHEHHDDHEEHEKHEEHAKQDDHDGHYDDHDEKHGHDEHQEEAHKSEKHGEEHGQADHELNAHIWLDPQNAAVMVSAIAEAMSEIDPANAAKYAANAKSTQTRLADLTTEITSLVAAIKGKPFVVFHDAYQAFEARFGIPALGSLTVNPQINPGAERIDQIQKKIRSLSAVCVFAEPQFKSSMVNIITEGTKARQGVLDPLGSTLEDGPELYFTMMRNMAGAFRDCLQGQ